MAIEKVIKIKVDSKDAVKGVEDVDKSIKDVDNSTAEMSKTLDNVSGGFVSKFKGMKGAIKTVISSFKSLKVAIIGTGIGALVIAVVALGQAFTRSEEGQNKFAKIMGVIGSITDNLLDLLADLGEYIIGVFENPKKAIQDFAKLIKEQIVNRFTGLLELIPKLGEAIVLLFKGEWEEAAKVAANATAKVTLGVENIVDKTQNAINKTKEFVKELENEARIAANIADLRAAADKEERELIIDRANAERDIADLRFKSEQRNLFTVKERIKFLKDASKIEEDITKREIANAQRLIKAQFDENNLAKSTKEAKEKLANLQADAIRLATKELNLKKRLETRIQSLIIEERGLTKAKTEEQRKQLEDLDKFYEELVKKDAELYQERQNLLNEFNNQNEDDELKKEDERQARILDIWLKNTEQRKLTEEELINEEEARILAELDRLKASEEQKQAVREFYAKKRFDIEAKTDNATVKLRENTFKLLGALAEKGSALAKGLAIVEIVREQVKSVSDTVQSTVAANAKAVAASPLTAGQPFVGINTAQAAIGIASGVATAAKSIQSILSEKKSVNGGGASVSSSAGVSAPSFNLIEGTGTNQIAESITTQDKPIKAYVVSEDVTTAQDLDNDAINNASI